jgi:putative sigma-54 modulation protein
MNKIIMKAKNFEITQALKDFITDKFSKFERYEKHIAEIIVELKVEKNLHIADNKIVDVNIYVTGTIIRAEEANHDMYASIDSVIDKLERQLEKYEDLRFRNHKSKLKTKDNENSEFYPKEEIEISTY